MKRPNIIWFVFLAALAVCLWSLFPRTTKAPRRIKVERDISDTQQISGRQVVASYDPYFVHQNFVTVTMLTNNPPATQAK